LVCDFDGLDVVPGEVGVGEGLPDHFTGVVPDFLWIVLDPTGLLEYLFVFELTG
jgi:hypothetical protein